MSHDPQADRRSRRDRTAVRAVPGVCEPVRSGSVAQGLHPGRGVQRLRHEVSARADDGAAGRGAARPVHRATCPWSSFDGDRATGMQHFVFIDQKTHAMRLAWYQRRVRAHARRLAHPATLDHVHAQARGLRLRPAARPARDPQRRDRPRLIAGLPGFCRALERQLCPTIAAPHVVRRWGGRRSVGAVHDALRNFRHISALEVVASMAPTERRPPQ